MNGLLGYNIVPRSRQEEPLPHNRTMMLVGCTHGETTVIVPDSAIPPAPLDFERWFKTELAFTLASYHYAKYRDCDCRVPGQN